MNMSCATALEARENYVELIRREMVGPGSELPALVGLSVEQVEAFLAKEVLSEKANKRYSIGILFPQMSVQQADDDDAFASDTSSGADMSVVDERPEEAPVLVVDGKNSSLDEGEDAGGVDHGEDLDDSVEDSSDFSNVVGMANQNKPSSMGFTFFADRSFDSLTFKVSFATYRDPVYSDCHWWIAGESTADQVEHRLNKLGLSECVGYSAETRTIGWRVDDISPDTFNGAGFADNNLDKELKSALWHLWGQLHSGCVREPHEIEIAVDFTSNEPVKSQVAKGVGGTKQQHFSLYHVRRELKNGLWAYTVMLVNEETSADKGVKDADCMCQAKVEVRVEDNGELHFVSYAGYEDFDRLDAEEKSLELLYRSHGVYATGLGTSVRWDKDETGAITSVATESFPVESVPGMKFSLPEGADCGVLSMRYLSDIDNTPKDDKIIALNTFVELYSEWITEQKNRANELDQKLKQVANGNIAKCEECFIRMKAGIDWLAAEGHDRYWRAFQWANRAMFMQRIQGELQKRNKLPDDCAPDNEAVVGFCNLLQTCDAYARIDPDATDEMLRFEQREMPQWRPFQLAFLLMCIRSMSDDQCPERDLVDLIWFPTGGGKTEAYLGLTAYTIFQRRLCHLDNSSGTAVMMRYTLRLLANQQFERAAKLICACDFIRSAHQEELGGERISIGLWIGSSQTPNKNDEALAILKKMRGKEIKKDPETKKKWADGKKHYMINSKANKFQILKCPWCGASLMHGDTADEWGYKEEGGSFVISCPNLACHFRHENTGNGWGGLSLQVVDEELYRNVPTLLFGTVDKFAQITWKHEPYAFFGKPYDDRCRSRSPELIIQDELHLISGPLGTIVGLYESAIDYLCSAKGVKPKIIASTATIRRADEQCSALYNRDYRQFPPPCLDAGNSFYACENEDPAKKRLYVGLMPAGKTKVMMEGRSLAALLQRPQMMSFASDVLRDKLWTITAYFNSLKELGKCLTVINEDVQQHLARVASSTGTMGTKRRYVRRVDELTSRVDSFGLADQLKRLENTKYAPNLPWKDAPTDLLLATNMISVGIDVGRLNVMFMVGQPKCTSEYIQASSRVGRSDPGVVFVLYDAAKSRDRTHYEQFKAYHQSFYKFVEPTGATPFSRPALDRALHAVLVACLRGTSGMLVENDDCVRINRFRTEGPTQYQALVERFSQFMVGRYRGIIDRAVDNGHSAPGSDGDLKWMREQIEKLLQEWCDYQQSTDAEKRRLYYGRMCSPADLDTLARRRNTPEDQLPSNTQRWLLRVFGSLGSVLGAHHGDPRERAWDTLTAMRNVDAQVKGCLFVEEKKQ